MNPNRPPPTVPAEPAPPYRLIRSGGFQAASPWSDAPNAVFLPNTLALAIKVEAIFVVAVFLYGFNALFLISKVEITSALFCAAMAWASYQAAADVRKKWQMRWEYHYRSQCFQFCRCFINAYSREIPSKPQESFSIFAFQAVAIIRSDQHHSGYAVALIPDGRPQNVMATFSLHRNAADYRRKVAAASGLAEWEETQEDGRVSNGYSRSKYSGSK